MAEKLHRNLVVQYCLNQGTGITYRSQPDFNPAKCETTELEKLEAERRNVSPRYVLRETVDWFLSHPLRHQIIETVENNYDLCDFDDWMCLQNLLDLEMPRKISDKINNFLWDKYDLCPREIPEVDYHTLKNMYDKGNLTEKEILEFVFGVELREEDYGKLAEIFIFDLGIAPKELFINRILNI